MYKHTFYYFLGNKKYPEIYILQVQDIWNIEIWQNTYFKFWWIGIRNKPTYKISGRQMWHKNCLRHSITPALLGKATKTKLHNIRFQCSFQQASEKPLALLSGPRTSSGWLEETALPRPCPGNNFINAGISVSDVHIISVF